MYVRLTPPNGHASAGDDVEMGLLGGVDRFLKDRVGLGPVQVWEPGLFVIGLSMLLCVRGGLAWMHACVQRPQMRRGWGKVGEGIKLCSHHALTIRSHGWQQDQAALLAGRVVAGVRGEDGEKDPSTRLTP